MGLFAKFFGLTIDCPLCGRPFAKENFSGVSCWNPVCRNFTPGRACPGVPNPTPIVYRNYAGEEKTFWGDLGGAVKAGELYLRVKVAPSGERITLKRERIKSPRFA